MCGPERYASRIPNKLELRIIALVGQGLKNSEIAQAIGTTEFVVKNHLRAIYDKLGSGIVLKSRFGMKLANIAIR
jgi:DNA-binding NarL/FixJ family response regulator